MRRWLCLLVGLGSSCFPALAQRIVRERLYNPSGGSITYYAINDIKRAANGQLLVVGNFDRNTGSTHEDRLLRLNASTLDTIWNRRGLTVPASTHPVHEYHSARVGYVNTVDVAGTWQYYLLRLSASGQRLGTTVLANPYGTKRQIGGSLLAPDGGYFVAGTDFGAPRRRGELLRTDSLGNVLWTRYQGWRAGDYWNDISYTADSTLLLAGVTQQPTGNGAWALKLLEVNQQGDSVRAAELSPWGTRGLIIQPGYHRTLPLPDGGFLFPVQLDSLTAQGRQLAPLAALVKVNRQLQLEWSYVYRPPGPLRFRAYHNAVPLQDGSVLVLGYELQPLTNELLLHRISATGQLLQVIRLPSSVCGGPRPVCVAADGRTLYLAGECMQPVRLGYVAVVDLQGLPPALPIVTAAKPPEPAAPALAVFPNPAGAGAAVTVRAEAGPPGRTLRLLDGLGRMVRQAALPVGGETQLPTAGLPGGLYLLQLRDAAGRLRATQKLVVP